MRMSKKDKLQNEIDTLKTKLSITFSAILAVLGWYGGTFDFSVVKFLLALFGLVPLCAFYYLTERKFKEKNEKIGDMK